MRVILYVFPIFSLDVFELSVFKLCLGLPQFFFLGRFVKFLFGGDEGKLGIFFLILFLEIFEDGIYIIAISNSRSIVLHSFVLE